MTLRPAIFDRDVLPLEITTSFSLKTAKALSLTAPESFPLRSDEVINSDVVMAHRRRAYHRSFRSV